MRSALVLEVRECRERECVCSSVCAIESVGEWAWRTFQSFQTQVMLLYQLSLFCTKKYQPSPESDGIVTKPIDNEGAKASSQSLGKRGLGIWFLFGWKRLNRGMWEFSCSSCSCSSWSSLIHPRLNVPPSAGKSSTCLIWTASLSLPLTLAPPLPRNPLKRN